MSDDDKAPDPTVKPFRETTRLDREDDDAPEETHERPARPVTTQIKETTRLTD